MSKSLGEKHHIGLFEEENSIRKKVKSAITDTGSQQGNIMSPGVENLFNLIKACGKEKEYNELLKQYKSGSLKYKDLKEVTADALVELTKGFITRKNEIAGDETYIKNIAKKMSQKARDIAAKTIRDVRSLVGLPAHD
jgi:tryptophanyl-tRNA synthetase